MFMSRAVPIKLFCSLVLSLCVCGCFTDSRPDPKSTFDMFVKACSSGDVRSLQMLLTRESWAYLQEEFQRDYGSFDKGIGALAEQTKKVPPQFVRVEPVQKHLLERIYFKRDQITDYLQLKWNDNQWQIALRSAEIVTPSKNGELQDFTPQNKE